MTFLHDYLAARERVREVTARLTSAILTELEDNIHPDCDWDLYREGRSTSEFPDGENTPPDTIRIRLAGLPDGYILEIQFNPIKETTSRRKDPA
jgi:hypothetical protein